MVFELKNNIYIINSPQFPNKEDFEIFPVWCEWQDAEEVPYLKSLCSSESEFESKVVAPYEKGKETYYPITTDKKIPDRQYVHVLVDVVIGKSITAKGYASVVSEEIVSVTVWFDSGEDLTLYKSDRLVAEDDNPAAIKAISDRYRIPLFDTVTCESNYIFSNGEDVCCTMKLA